MSVFCFLGKGGYVNGLQCKSACWSCLLSLGVSFAGEIDSGYFFVFP